MYWFLVIKWHIKADLLCFSFFLLYTVYTVLDAYIKYGERFKKKEVSAKVQVSDNLFFNLLLALKVDIPNMVISHKPHPPV